MKFNKKRALVAVLSICMPLALIGCKRDNSHEDANSNATSTAPAAAAPGGALGAATSTNSTPATPASAPTKVIVKDTFQENPNSESYQTITIVGVKPAPIDLPGAAWQLASGDGAYEAYLTAPGELGYIACFHHAASAALRLASNGAYVKPAILTISADLSFGGDSAFGFCLLGFYSALPRKDVANTLANFTGLAFYKNGALRLVENGVTSPTAIKYTGNYDPILRTVTLSYSIDTTKGALSNISLTGSTSTYAITSSAFTDSATAFVGIGGSTDGVSTSNINNLQISSGVIRPAPPQESAQTNAP